MERVIPLTNVGMQTVWTARQADWEYMKNNIENPDGTPISWINRWHDNPYWMAYNWLNPQTKNRLIGTASLKYEFTDWLSLTVRAGTDYQTEKVEVKRAYHSINYREGRYQVSNLFPTGDQCRFSPLCQKGNFKGLYIIR